VLIFVLAGAGGYVLITKPWVATQPTNPSPQASAPAKPSDGSPAPTVKSKHPDILLITVDSVRPDSIGCYGGTPVPTPAIDSLAASGVRFANAVTAVPVTRPSHASILTGLYPLRHGVRDNGSFVLDAAQRSVAEVLHEAGYATAAFVSAFLLDSRYGLNQGFDHFDQAFTSRRSYPFELEGMPFRPGDQTIDAALRWIGSRHQAAAGRPLFVWIHLFDAQTPYVVPEPHATAHGRQPYRAAIAFLDEQVGRVIQYFKGQGRLAETMIVLVGAHGEALMEHGEETHGCFLYESTVSVPFILHYPPKLSPGRVIGDSMAATLDVAPTMLALAGVLAGLSFDGINLFGSTGGGRRVIHLETRAPQLRHGWSGLWAARSPTAKFINAPVPEFYDLSTDPGETANLLASDPGQLTSLRQTFAEQQRATFGSVPEPWSADRLPVADALRRLSEMGYRVTPAERPRAAPLDPKGMLDLFDRNQLLFSILRIGRLGEAAQGYREMAADSPQDPTAWAALSVALEGSGPLGEAIDAAIQAVQLQPYSRHWLVLARLLWQKGDAAACDLALEAMRQIDPQDGGIALLMGRRQMAAGKLDQAVGLFEQARRDDPFRQSGNALAWIGEARRAQGNDAAAREAYLEALTFDPASLVALEGMAGVEQRAGRVDAQASYLRQLAKARPAAIVYANELAQLFILSRRDDEAAEAMKEYLARNPNDIAAMSNLGNVYQLTGRTQEAIETYRKALKSAPDYAMGRFNLAAALAFSGQADEAIEEYRKVIDLRPEHSLSSKRLLILLSSEGRLDEAFAELERAAALGIVDWDDWSNTEELASLVGDPRFAEIQGHYGE